ncbi:MAG: hypothetical protein U9Q70_05410 [Chloroflexota bacterium]|nr:hypothetical protein [Chloroflexota bacterium]
MFLPYSVINPLTLIEVERRLPRAGEVLVAEGEMVESFQLVAKTTEQPQFGIVNIARELHLSPQKVKSALKVKVGAQVSAGTILATRGMLGGRVSRAPFDGTITGYGHGRLLLEAPLVEVQLNALLPGRVVRIWAEKGVTVQTYGAFVQGVWGNNKEGYGVLQLAVRAPHQPLRARRLDASMQGAIIVGGTGLDAAVLAQAADMQVGGLIVGGVSAELLPELAAVDFPILITEGIGEIPLSAAAFTLLRDLAGREAVLSARLGTHWKTERPYVAVPMPAESARGVDSAAPLAIGSQVRALRAPLQGKTGVISELPLDKMELETGARLAGAYVDFDGEVDFVPFSNLERIL